jgi:hypothetical protein
VTIFGWDMSHYDAPSIGSAVKDGIVFLTHKAGGDAVDSELDDWWSGVKNLGDSVLLGAYWVLYPGTPVTRADQFLARLDASCPGWRNRPWILQVDCERWGGGADTVPSKSEIAAFCDRLVAKMPKLRPIVYAPKWVYGDKLDGLGYPLWASSYVSGSGSFKALYPGDSSSKWAAYSGQTPAILQYSSKATIGGQATSDANAFRGTLAQLTALVAPGWTEDDLPSIDELLGADRIPNDINPGVKGQPGYNENMTIEWALRYASHAQLALNEAKALRKDVAAVASAVASIGSTGKLTQQQVAALQAAVDQVDENVADRLVGDSAEETAAKLAAVLGDQAAAVGRILAGIQA